MFKDGIRASVFQQLRSRDLRAFVNLLTPEVIQRTAQRSGLRLGDNPLNLAHLTWLAVASAWHTTRNFADVLGLTLKLLCDADAWQLTQVRPEPGLGRRSKHNPRGIDRTQVSEEAFAKARKLVPWPFWTFLIVVLAERFQQQHPAAVRYKGFRLLALDGTCINLESWKPLSAHFGTARSVERMVGPVTHVWRGLPWA